MLVHFFQRLGSQVVPLVVALLLASLPVLPPVLDGLHSLSSVLPRQLVLMACLVVAYYLNMKIGVPRLLLRGRRPAYVLFVGALLLTTTWTAALLAPPPRPEHTGTRPPWSLVPTPPRVRPADGFLPHPPGFMLVIFMSTFIIVGVGTQLAVARHGREQLLLSQRLEQEKQQVELSYLKQQLNPHFFFNTLNNIYALTEVDVPRAQQALYKLSRIMRYVLYQTQEPAVLLSQEVTFLQDYVSLMQLRMMPTMQVDFTVPEPLDDRTIAPLLLLPFLENAFKYGVSTAQPATIGVLLSQTGSALTLEVRNRIFTQPRTALAEGSGIGLANTRRRLALLYPGRHTLRITERTPAGEFAVHLTLQLSP
ncbi:histidine kinase [Hymenobacter sp. BT175]|uniref:sensor histidine kinase n=1 Tax=Hymenobacter translucens TaxID=2886507 RepID=UPI001D0E09B9|nr:histidine kinase [Hymenobacter translucens]MCC2546463.1 histidine kinase [Hymenobacter translucens]